MHQEGCRLVHDIGVLVDKIETGHALVGYCTLRLVWLDMGHGSCIKLGGQTATNQAQAPLHAHSADALMRCSYPAYVVAWHRKALPMVRTSHTLRFGA